ncbi:MAG: protein kinase domain-containing protein [Terriglobales bacterium]
MGTRLGPYEIGELIGAGGMGQVYRARDTRLDRTVAIKILSRDQSLSAEQKQRFEREAKTISSLQHPHICVLYDIGSENGLDYLVMEYLEGQSLADRLRRGPLPTEEVLKVGMEIAGALERAHRQGLVHRDLKPGNIMLTKSGAKLLDFGLAKPAAVAIAAASGEEMPTFAGAQQQVTARGTIVGTFQYMSPEQLQGKEADARSDLFALGAVLYEAATGKAAFTGQTQISVMSAILEREPEPVTSISAASPAALDYVIRTCLAKDPDQRFQTAHDVGLQLKWIAGLSATALLQLPSVSRRRRRGPTVAGWALAAALLVSLVTVLVMRRAPSTKVVRFSIPLLLKHAVPADSNSLAISADGSRLAYGVTHNGVNELYVRALDRFDPVLIPNSDGATFPFFSPDGHWVAFFSRGHLRKAASDGSTNPTSITELPAFYGGSWLPDGDILMASATPLSLVSSDGGAPRILPTKEAGLNTESAIMLPEKKWVLFTRDRGASIDIFAYNMSSGETRQLLADAMQPVYSDGKLMYYSSGSLWEASFDPDKARFLGPAVVVIKGVAAARWYSYYAVSETGTLAYVPGGDQTPAHDLVWVDRKGNPTKIDVPADDYVDPAIAPDGKHFVVCIRTFTSQSLAVYDMTRNGMMRMSGNTRRNAAPAWDPSSKYLYFDGSTAEEKRALYRLLADGSAAPELLHTVPSFGHVSSVAADKVSVMVADPVTKNDLWMMSPDGKQFTPFRKTPADERQGSFSPDGKFLAYASDESGLSEVYVESAGGSGARWQISIGGGEQPRWSHKGNEIFYRVGTKMMSVSVQENPFSSGKPVELFDADFDRGGAVPGYDVTPDGQHFLMSAPVQASPTEIRVVIGWPAELKQNTGKSQ